MWNWVYFKSAKNQRMNNSFAVNYKNNIIFLLCTVRGDSSTKKWMETLHQPCATILLNHTPMCIQAFWRLGGWGGAASVGQIGTVRKLDKV